MDLYGELEWRGLIHEASEGVRTVLKEKISGYIGFDPTASSLHVGSLLPILALARMRGFGHDVIALVGGGTGLIGDPSGKTAERRLLDEPSVKGHVEGIRKQLTSILTSGSREMRRLQPETSKSHGRVRFVDNATWLKSLKAINFMRDVGKHFTVNWMLAKESVKRRLDSQEGISYTEFSYLLLQAYDFLELNKRYKCTLQMGGSDQWGNILAGIELIRRVRSEKVHGLVLPLVTTSSGAKFGKTEAGTIWLDPTRTKQHEFYQFWLNVDDRDAVKYLKFFTFLSEPQISELASRSADEPEKRHTQRELALQVTRLVHGEKGAREAEIASAKLFSRDMLSMPASQLLELFANVPSSTLPEDALRGEGMALVDVLVSSGLTKSKSEGMRLIRSGGIYVNNLRVTNDRARLRTEEAIGGQLFLLRKGAKQNHVLKVQRK